VVILDEMGVCISALSCGNFSTRWTLETHWEPAVGPPLCTQCSVLQLKLKVIALNSVGWCFLLFCG